MKNAARISAFTLALLFSLSLCAQECAPPPPPHVKGDFKLTVVDWTKAPQAGIKVTLGSEDRYKTLHPVAVGATDADGVLYFKKLAAGPYALQFTDHEGERQWFHVVVASDGEDAAEYAWPHIRWLPVRSAGAILIKDNEPMRHYRVTLIGYPDGEQLGNSDTDINGRFDLPATQVGRYWVDVATSDGQGNLNSLGRIPIYMQLSTDSRNVETIFVQQGKCGLVFDEWCSLPAAKLKGSCMQTVNDAGQGITNANVTLRLQHSYTSSTVVRSDKDGYVKLPNLAAGDYELTITAKGYAPVHQAVALAPGDAGCNSAIVVPMYTFGSGCVPATQGKGK